MVSFVLFYSNFKLYLRHIYASYIKAKVTYSVTYFEKLK